MADDQQTGALGIVVGGGPAPGINAVIAAATIRTRLSGTRVVGIQNGFERLMEADAHGAQAFRELDIQDVSRIHFRGGSMLGTSRANPTRRDELLDQVLSNLRSAGIDKLVTIGGDDTSFTCSRLAGDRMALSPSPTSRRPSTTTSTCHPRSTPSAIRPPGRSASRWSRT